MAVLDTVKKALRISHTKLDDELTRLIAVARAELKRVGVADGVAEGDDGLVIQSIVTFCLIHSTEDIQLIDKYQKAWNIQADGIRKCSDVNQEVEDGV